MADITFQNHGSIVLISGDTDAGQAWLDENIGDDAQEWCGSIVAEPRYVEAIVDGAIDAGLAVTS